MTSVPGPEAFFTKSGSSPPAAQNGAPEAPRAAVEAAAEMPTELAEELGRLLAEALVADIKQYPNLADIKASEKATVESPPGHNRNSAEPSGIGAGIASPARRSPLGAGCRRPRSARLGGRASDAPSVAR
jgi:hypothetical protein